MAMTYYFPWIRKGLGNFIQEKDAFVLEKGAEGDELVRTRPEILLTAEYVAEREGTFFPVTHEKTVKFVGPSDIAGISEKVVMKVVPESSSDTFPIQYYPYMEFWEPDFPWRYSPASQNADKLRPWIALVCCEAEAVKMKSLPNGNDYFSFVGTDEQWADSFLKPSELWRAAHAQGSASDRPELARLLALRNAAELKKGTDYIVLLVPAFETGRLRGLGKGEAELADIPAQFPSWDEALKDQNNREMGLMFPVYASWTFKAGDDDFEAAVARLKPFSAEKDGILLDVSKMGDGLDYDQVSHFSSRRTIEMPAATKLIGSEPQPPFPAEDNPTESILYKNIRTLLEQNPVFVENESDKGKGFGTTYTGDDDPLVVPPVYGARHVMASSLDEVGWVESLNMDVHYRAAAGLGRSIVQTHQEELMNRAWKQVNAVNALNMELYNRLLSLDTNKALQSKLPHLVKGKNSAYIASLIRLLGSMADASDGKVSLSSILGDADIPKAFASATFQRTTDRLSKLVSGLDMGTLMERLVREQFYRKGIPVRHDAFDASALLEELENARKGHVFYDRLFSCPMTFFIKYDWNAANTLEDGVGDNLPLKISTGFSDVKSLPDSRSSDPYLQLTRGGVFVSDPFYYLTGYFHTINSVALGSKNKADFIVGLLEQFKAFFEDGYSRIPTFGYVVPDQAMEEINQFVSDIKMDYSTRTDWDNWRKIPAYGRINFNESDGELTILSKGRKTSKGQVYDYSYSLKPNLVILPEGHSLGLDEQVFLKYGDRYYISAGDYEAWAPYTPRHVCYHEATRAVNVNNSNYMVVSNGNLSDSDLAKFINIGTLGSNDYVDELISNPGDMLRIIGVNSISSLVEMDGKDVAEWMSILAELYHYILRVRTWIQTHPSFVIVPERKLDSVDLGLNSGHLGKRGIYTWKKGEPVDRLFYVDSKRFPWWTKLEMLRGATQTLKTAVESCKSSVSAPKPSPVSTASASALQQALDNNEAYERMREVAEMYYAEFFADTVSGQALREAYLDELLRSKYPILAYPQFPEPTSYYLRMMSEKFIVPGSASLPTDSVSMFESNAAFIEAFLCGMNTEMGQELMWREYPTDRRGSYFRKFWDSESTVSAIRTQQFFDIKPVHTWDAALGGNHLESKADLLIFAIRGTFLKQFPSTRIFLQRAVADIAAHTLDFDAGATEENGGILRPVMETFLNEDTLLVGFKTNTETALGNPADNDFGYFLAFEEDVQDLNFEHADLKGATDAAKTADRLTNKPTIVGKHVSQFVLDKKPRKATAPAGQDGGTPPASPGSTALFAMPDELYCDGVYRSTAQFKVDLGNSLDRSSFELSFDFKREAGTSENDNILVLDSYYRSLSLEMNDKGKRIRIGINNGNKYYNTSVTFKEGEWNHIDLLYRGKMLTINGKTFSVGLLNGPGNNILSSNNYSNGHCFKGQIKNVVVKNH